MQNRRESAVIMFADLSMLLITVLISGYFFLQIKKDDEASQQEAETKLEKELILPDLDDNGSVRSTEDTVMSEVKVFRDGGRFAVDGKEVVKSELETVIRGVKAESLRLEIDGKAPSEDTLFLLDILTKLKLKSIVPHR